MQWRSAVSVFDAQAALCTCDFREATGFGFFHARAGAGWTVLLRFVQNLDSRNRSVVHNRLKGNVELALRARFQV